MASGGELTGQCSEMAGGSYASRERERVAVALWDWEKKRVLTESAEFWASMSNNLPPALVANLQNVLAGRRGPGGGDDPSQRKEDPGVPTAEDAAETNAGEPKKPIVLVTNGDGIGSPGLAFLVEALVRSGQCDVHVCAPESDQSASGHSITLLQTLAATSAGIEGATAFEISGSPADCVSLALSGALFAWSKPALVISGINKGSNCGRSIFYSGALAGAREALICGVPSLAISLNWQKDENKESDFKDAVDACLPLINAAIRDSEKGLFPQNCLLNIEIPTEASKNKGFKLTRQTLRRTTPHWRAVTTHRNPAAVQLMSMRQGLGIQLAQLGRDASAAGAARRNNAQKKNVEVESVAETGKPLQKEAVKKFFRLELLEKEQEASDEDLDFKALDDGFIAVTPLHLQLHLESETQTSASDWLATVVTTQGESS